ncbi:MAG: hypothetical protein ACJAX3_000775 [Patiriisocius sp.]|jgi:hypothetical protein
MKMKSILKEKERKGNKSHREKRQIITAVTICLPMQRRPL